MRDNVPCTLPAGYDGLALLEGLAQVPDPELDEPILDLGLCAPWICIPIMPASRCSCRPAGAR
jgi:hypothetical protein